MEGEVGKKRDGKKFQEKTKGKTEGNRISGQMKKCAHNKKRKAMEEQSCQIKRRKRSQILRVWPLLVDFGFLFCCL